MAGNPLSGLLGSETIKSILIWQVLGQIFQPILAPVAAQLQQDIFGKFPDLALSPSDAVDAALKGHMDQAAAQAEAALSGIDADRFQVLLESAGEPPGLQQLLELWRRGVIAQTGIGPQATSVEQGIRESRIHPKWTDALYRLKTSLPSPTDALDALLEGQIDQETATSLYEAWGGDPRYFQLMFDTRGSAPTPLEAAEMARRGIIPWNGSGPEVTSYEQAFLEGPWRNKWEQPYRALADYIPPPRTVTALLREGAITDAQGETYLKAAGLAPELAQAYIDAAHKPKAQAAKDLTQGQILQLYAEGGISAAEATADLGKLDVPAAVAADLLKLEDLKAARRQQQAAVTRVRSLYEAHKITEQEALSALHDLGLSDQQAGQQLTTWTLERDLKVERVSAATIVGANHYGLLSGPAASGYLQQLGYSAWEAWLLLAERNHGPLEDLQEPPAPATLA